MAPSLSYRLFDSTFTTWIPVVILELIHAKNPDCLEGMYLLDKKSMLFELFDDS